MNKDESVHPLELTLIIEPEGAPTTSLSVIRLRGNINNALIAHTTVTVASLSPLVIFETCRLPFVAIIFPGLWTFVIPVSSIFQSCLAETYVPQIMTCILKKTDLLLVY